ncbi:Type 2A phosphatase activator TIP41 [Nakaseomyces bracarensis]|uniref:Type 2A phosphatase activator TIP41 n=1 Tax=Nakaseomyces bracarensis TaxID=273131 RepID=A0ABR4P082_9SACH
MSKGDQNQDTRRGPGINAIQINAAREMHAMSVRGRTPGNNVTPSLMNTTASAQTFVAPSITKISKASIKQDVPTVTASASVTATSSIPHHVCNNPNNPECPHCGTVIIPSPRATLPLRDNPSITIKDMWKITTQKRPILNALELDDWEKNKLTKLPLPEMIFGNNFVRIDNVKTGWFIEFNALDALSMVNLEDTGLRVAHSKVWMQSKQRQQQKQNEYDNRNIDSNSATQTQTPNPLEIAHPYDWTYTTGYKGTLSKDSQFKRDDETQLPIDKLTRPDKILFFDDMILFEDELADNGISVLNVKIRVMHERLLLLSRFFLRVDDVLIRVYDTRVYVDFEDNQVIREFKKHESHYNDVLAKHQKSKKGALHDPKAALRDSNWVVEHTPLTAREVEVLHF